MLPVINRPNIDGLGIIPLKQPLLTQQFPEYVSDNTYITCMNYTNSLKYVGSDIFIFNEPQEGINSYYAHFSDFRGVKHVRRPRNDDWIKNVYEVVVKEWSFLDPIIRSVAPTLRDVPKLSK